MNVPLAIVAAVARNGVIGSGNRLPWHLSSDLKRFRAITMGKPLLMGRKTFEAIGRALPGRETVVVTHSSEFAAPGVHVVHTLEDGLASGQALAIDAAADEIILAGGGALYAALIDRVDRLHMTFVDLAPDGDVFFPAIDWSRWHEERRITPPRGPRDDAAFSFADFRRR